MCPLHTYSRRPIHYSHHHLKRELTITHGSNNLQQQRDCLASVMTNNTTAMKHLIMVGTANLDIILG